MRQTKQTWFEETEIVYQEVLDQLIMSLNRIHSTSFSKRFWDIFIGAWLREFVEIVMLQIHECEQGQPKITKPHKLTSVNSLVEYRKLSKTKYFVETLCLDTWSAINNLNFGRTFPHGTTNSEIEKSEKIRLGRKFYSATYLNRRAEVTLQIVSRRVPESLKVVDPPRTPLIHSLREAIRDCNADLCQKSKIIYALIPKYLPNVYLESFSFLVATKPDIFSPGVFALSSANSA